VRLWQSACFLAVQATSELLISSDAHSSITSFSSAVSMTGGKEAAFEEYGTSQFCFHPFSAPVLL
jgi:hypothetical protein